MIKAYIFDLGNVLVGFDREQVLRRLGDGAGCGSPAFKRAYAAAGIEDRLERGLMGERELFAWFQSLGFDGTFDEFGLLWCDHFHELKPVSSLLAELKGRAQILILSNTNSLHYRFLCARFPVLGLADVAVLSYQLGLRKPEPAIYRAALKAAGAQPHEAVFIDDMKDNVDAAAALGINAVRLDEPESVRELLKPFLAAEART